MKVVTKAVPETLYESRLESLELLRQGKVRDIYAVDESHLLIVATDRLSAFDVVLPDPIPGKGAVLTSISDFWFERTGHIVANHCSEVGLGEVLNDQDECDRVYGRGVVVDRLTPLPIEAVIRGYIIGSGWKDYQRTGAVCGISLPPGLRMADKLPAPIFTPATKAEVGEHDENIDFDTTVDIVGRETAEKVRDVSMALYKFAADYALGRGIIIADTKFEFALDDNGELVLIDEVLTPDSSRFWPVDGYEPGKSPPSFDKQFVRDYLETLDWDKTPPAPNLPDEIIKRTSEKYHEALTRLTGTS